MKRAERHRLKENDFARTVARARDVLEERRRDVGVLSLVIVVAIAAVGGYFWWRYERKTGADRVLAAAIAVYEAPVIPLAAPAPGSPAPLPQPGTYTTEEAKLQAALPKFVEASDRYPNTSQGIAARFHEAAILASLGRYPEAEQRYQDVVNRGGRGIYARTARIGLADTQVAQGKYDSAITIYTELSRDANAQLPVDSILLQLGRAYVRAGKKEEAVRAFNRIVAEFPQSVYAADARRELEEAKKS